MRFLTSLPHVQISLLKSMSKPAGGFASAGDIQATVEAVDPGRNVLFIRFYEGPASLVDRRSVGLEGV